MAGLEEVEMTYENIILQKENGIAKLTLNRPKVLNALNSALVAELKQALQEINKDETIDVVILTGAGRAFCAGMDLKALGESLEPFEAVADIFYLLDNLDPPVIAAVNGFAITGGFELALACDLIVASEDAVFRDTHAQVGVIPGGGNSQRLPRLVGEKKAKELLFTSEFISAKEAERIGLINRVVPAEKLEEEVMQLAKKIASQPRDMIRKLKRTVNEGMKMNFGSAMMFEQIEFRRHLGKMAAKEIEQRRQAVVEGGRAEIKKE
jgi:enoyl-CoA hydratase